MTHISSANLSQNIQYSMNVIYLFDGCFHFERINYIFYRNNLFLRINLALLIKNVSFYKLSEYRIKMSPHINIMESYSH